MRKEKRKKLLIFKMYYYNLQLIMINMKDN